MGYVRRAIAAALVAIGAAASAFAQTTAHTPTTVTGVRIEGFDVEDVPRIGPGVNLAFTLYGTRGAEAQVRIEGADASLRLHETYPGIYDGVYTIGPRERIDPRATVIGSLRIGDQVARARLEEPLVLATPVDAGSSLAAAEPRRVVPAAAPGDDPPQASYHGAPRNALPAPLSPPRSVAPPPSWSPPEQRAACADCAVVESVQVVPTEPRSGTLGALLGGLTGALLGDRVADRVQRRWAAVVGAIGGALAGRAIERSAAVSVRYDVWLRLPDGTRQVRSYPDPPPYRPGDVVRMSPVALASAAR